MPASGGRRHRPSPATSPHHRRLSCLEFLDHPQRHARSGAGPVAGTASAWAAPASTSTPDCRSCSSRLAACSMMLTLCLLRLALPARPSQSSYRTASTKLATPPRERQVGSSALRWMTGCVGCSETGPEHRALGGSAHLPARRGRSAGSARPRALAAMPAASASASTTGSSASRFGKTALGEIRGGSMMRNSAMRAEAVDVLRNRGRLATCHQLVVVLAQHVVVARRAAPSRPRPVAPVRQWP